MAHAEFDLKAPGGAAPIGIGEHSFADVGNLEHCAKYLNQTLVTFGFPASLDLFANDPVSVARTCNCIYSLLQQRQRDIEFRESSNEQRQRLQSDISRLEAKIERLEAQLAAKDRELATLTRTVCLTFFPVVLTGIKLCFISPLCSNDQASHDQEAKNTAALKAQIEKLQQERDEYQKMVIGNQQVRTQQIHEMKKKEKEYIKLQERLNQVLMEKKKESRSGMEIMNLLQKEGRQRGTWNGKKADNDFYKMIADAYEVKKQELMQENSDLRALLRSMQMDMRDFLNAPNGLSQQTLAGNEKQDAGSPQSPLGGRTDVFDLPFHMARDQIEESLRTKMASIKASIMSKHFAKSDKPRRLSGHLDAERESIHSALTEVGKKHCRKCTARLYSRPTVHTLAPSVGLPFLQFSTRADEVSVYK
ncbi:Afadin- and alpha-actinin-binding protein [Ananas comosus]|uniref:Afadin-and alpha-actinin-binding protein n=1 Tax=Ananas comosus TaxID=4615 RepID=A0A199UU82_ANACO|nr:Afadin- and alpha-actinin-binding protein [Ananas comosus]